jgi:hypothetical protein
MGNLRNVIKSNLRKILNEEFEISSVEDFEEALLNLATLDLEDNQVGYPKINNRKQNYLFGGRNYDLYILDKEALPNSGPFEISIQDNDDVIGFIRGSKKNNIISFNLIHIKEDYRGLGIGTNIYETFLNDGFIIKSDDEITDSTYSIYNSLVKYGGIKPIVFDDGRVGLKK